MNVETLHMDPHEWWPYVQVRGTPAEDWLAHVAADATFYTRTDLEERGLRIVTAIVEDVGFTLIVDATDHIVARSYGRLAQPGGVFEAHAAVLAQLEAGHLRRRDDDHADAHEPGAPGVY